MGEKCPVMESALIVSSSDKNSAYLADLLKTASFTDISILGSCGEARRFLLERELDLVVINAPLGDETGENLSRHIASSHIAQVILLVRSEHFAAVSAICEGDGVLCVSKPMNRDVFWSALSLARATGSRLRRIRGENERLKQKIEDIRIIDRAKCILIAVMNMTEPDAHRYIEKQAMDMRQSKRVVAEGILRTYEN